MTREESKRYLKNHPDAKVREALETLCLMASLDTVKLTMEIDGAKLEETLETVLGAGLLAKAQALQERRASK